jgi:hypothetical protein
MPPYNGPKAAMSVIAGKLMRRERVIMAGFVYVMSNSSFAVGRIKIGKSDRDPEEFRNSELYSTGVPEPFRVEYYVFVKDHHELERKIHRHFVAQRPNKNREFFTCSIMDAISEIRDAAGDTLKLEVNNFAAYEELKREQMQREAAQREKAAQKKRLEEAQRGAAQKKRLEEVQREAAQKKRLEEVQRVQSPPQTNAAAQGARTSQRDATASGGIRKFLGNGLKLLVICLLIGWVLSVIEVDALGFIRFISQSLRNLGNLAADAVGWVAPYILLGAVIVIPIYMVKLGVDFIRRRRQ